MEFFMTKCMGRLTVYLILVWIFKFNVKHFREILTQMVRSSSLRGRGEKGGEKRAINEKLMLLISLLHLYSSATG